MKFIHFICVGKLALDKGVANRFIKHAIAQANLQRPPGDTEAQAGPSEVRVPVKVTSKMEARAQYEKELKELGDEEESDLEVFDDRAEGATPEVEKQEPVTSSGKSKGKAKASEPVPRANPKSIFMP